MGRSGGLRGSGRGIEDARDGRVVVRGRDEPRLEHATAAARRPASSIAWKNGGYRQPPAPAPPS